MDRWKEKATALHSRLVRARGRCEHCGAASEPLECAHIVSRRYSATRCDLDNGVCLCGPCHSHFTAHPDEWKGWIGEERWGRLTERARPTPRMDWRAVHRQLLERGPSS